MLYTITRSLLVAILLVSTARAQVFIPDLVLRDSLNAQVPGIVDGAGMLDELHPGIAGIDTLSVLITGSDPVVDVSGLEYLTSLIEFELFFAEGSSATELRLPQVPQSLRTLDIGAIGDMLIAIGPLPDSMDIIAISNYDFAGCQGRIEFEQLPDFTKVIEISSTLELSWPGNPHCGSFHYTSTECYMPAQNMALPALVTDHAVFTMTILEHLDISQLTARTVTLHGVQIGHIIWPPAVTTIHLTDGLVSYFSIPSFPAQVDSIFGDVETTCIPPLPEGLVHFDWPYEGGLGPYCFPNWPASLVSATLYGVTYTESTATYCSILNSDCPGAASSLSGRMVLDLNSNGLADAEEPRVPSSVIHLSSGAMVGPDATGHWEIGVHPGDYVIENSYTHPYVLGVTPSQHDVEVTASGQVHPNNDFAVAVMPNIQDLTAHLVSFPPRPGFNNSVDLAVENFGAVELDALVTFEFEAGQSWVTSSPAPTTMVGNSATWFFPDLQPGHTRHMDVQLNTGATIPLGTPLTYTLAVDPMATDATPENNQHSIRVIVVGACDPNDKLLSPAVLTPDEVAMGETPIEYTIRFQNTGTFLAERVVILDTLSEDLQWESMRFIASSHDQHWYIVDGVLHVIHNDIMLPDSNSNESASHGFFKFSMLPKTDLGNGSTIENIAHIIFDFNAPIITPAAVFTVDIGAGIDAGSKTSTLRILPNPAHDRIQLIDDEPTALPYRIVDLLGQEVQRGTALPNAWIDVQELVDGFYVLEVTKAGVLTSLRFMKQ